MLPIMLALAVQATPLSQSIDSGSKVSVSTGSIETVGRFQGADATHLTIGVGDQSVASLPLHRISDLRVYRGKDRWKGARRGALVGLALGGYFVADNYSDVSKNDYWGLETPLLFLLGGVIAPATGAAIGAALAPEGWSPLSIGTPDGTTATLQARTQLTLARGERIKLRARGESHSGSVVASSDSAVTLDDGEETTIRWRDVSDLRLRGGRHRVRGALLGAAALVAFGIYGESTEGATTSTGERIGAFTGAAAVGALLGSRFLGGRGWVPLPLPAR